MSRLSVARAPAVAAALLIATLSGCAEEAGGTGAGPGTSAGPSWQVRVGELDRSSDLWANRPVTVVGELIGDYSPRSAAVWVQLNDDPYVSRPSVETGRLAGGNVGIGVRMPLAEFDPEAWGSPGGYRVRGPIVEVSGIFHSGGPEQQGDTFVQAQRVDLVEPARQLTPPEPDLGAAVAGAVGVVLGAAALGWTRWRRLNPR